ncbi:hypothetical protein BRADI_2g46730v3 [Brachypodium distachyon]|uniref:Uncharacterized protein n=1 Tax=Brachypodium distachyon TaxID=15368 RepID=A0A0Q3GD40_BRADI|nr:hypothetical protein BRADI_2g46730v3 [Brachypodium distachyon]
MASGESTSRTVSALHPRTASPCRTPIRGEQISGGMASTGGGISDEVPIFHAENLTSNVKSINYSRTFLSIISGVVAGIWGFTGLTGFVFYFLVMIVSSLGLLVKAKFSVHTYFDSWNRILLEGVNGGLMVSLIGAVPM